MTPVTMAWIKGYSPVMTPDRRTLLGLAAAASAAPAMAAVLHDPTEVLRLWPKGAPGADKVTVKLQVTERSPTPKVYRDRFAIGITDPIMTVFRPATPDGSAVLIAPGGGYIRVVIDKEGFETAHRLAREGVTCFVLRYRLPGDGWTGGPDTPLQDAQRAIRLIRAKAADYGIDPARVGILGFSAGGHVASSLATRHGAKVFAPVDGADALSAKPAFAGLMYPVVSMTKPMAHPGSREKLLGLDPAEAMVQAYSTQNTVNADTPPCFLVHAIDDHTVPVENSLMMLSALRAAKVPAEMHLFEEGEHGFGIRLIQGKPAAVWPELLLTWIRRHGWLKS